MEVRETAGGIEMVRPRRHAARQKRNRTATLVIRTAISLGRRWGQRTCYRQEPNAYRRTPEHRLAPNFLAYTPQGTIPLAPQEGGAGPCFRPTIDPKKRLLAEK